MAGVCQAVQFTTIRENDGSCLGFTTRGDLADLVPKVGTNTYWKMHCNGMRPQKIAFDGQKHMDSIDKARTNGLTGPVFPNHYQPAGTPIIGYYTRDICFSLCRSDSRCQAVDYNKYTKECWIHIYSSCTSHLRAVDNCCDHFKKMACLS